MLYMIGEYRKFVDGNKCALCKVRNVQKTEYEGVYDCELHFFKNDRTVWVRMSRWTMPSLYPMDLKEEHLDALKFRKEENDQYQIFRRGMISVLKFQKSHTPYIRLTGEQRNFSLTAFLKEKNILATDNSVQVAEKLGADILDLSKLLLEMELFDIREEDLKRLAAAIT